MNRILSDDLLSQFSEFISSQLGLYFPKERWNDLERGISSASREFGFEDVGLCIQWLMSSPPTRDQIEILAVHLTIGETYFFREKKSFEILEEYILPELIRSRRGINQSLRIWSAGCCTGEEPYSIAILLSKVLPDWQDWHITILATDINPRFLKKASEGIYSEWSFRDTPLWIKEKYFRQKKKNQFEILPDIKKRVTFFYLNLAEGGYPSPLNNIHTLDIIFCRNVLIYFAPEEAKKVIRNLYLSLEEGGWLVTGSGEVSRTLFSQFTSVHFPNAILYRKMSGRLLYSDEFSCLTGITEIIPADGAQVKAWFNFIDGTTSAALGDQSAGKNRLPHQGTKETRTTPDEEPGFPERIPMKQPAKIPPTGDLYGEALILYEQGCYAEAAEKVLSLFSQGQKELNLQEKAAALLAKVYANQGKLQEALSWCKKAIAINKLNPGYHYLLGLILQEQGQMEEAMVALKRALYLDQNFVLAHFVLGNLTQQQGRFKESARYFENTLRLLQGYQEGDVLPESEGMTAGKLSELIISLTERRK
ncbi:MAG TPA: CheR family methyltransferase [Candidatus Limnocylindrales bacterium]|nr:CheR family methyltransferase [Candidatus Limnocylindrales bacterium]